MRSPPPLLAKLAWPSGEAWKGHALEEMCRGASQPSASENIFLTIATCAPPPCICSGKQCRGCDGVFDSGMRIDVCGNCGGGCIDSFVESRNPFCGCLGCDNVLHSNLTYDICGVCGGTNSVGLPHPNPPLCCCAALLTTDPWQWAHEFTVDGC